MKCPVCDTEFEGEECTVCGAPVSLGNDAEAWYEHGRNHWKSDRHGWASRSLERAVELDPDFALGFCELSKGREGGVSPPFFGVLQCFQLDTCSLRKIILPPRLLAAKQANSFTYHRRSFLLCWHGR